MPHNHAGTYGIVYWAICKQLCDAIEPASPTALTLMNSANDSNGARNSLSARLSDVQGTNACGDLWQHGKEFWWFYECLVWHLPWLTKRVPAAAQNLSVRTVINSVGVRRPCGDSAILASSTKLLASHIHLLNRAVPFTSSLYKLKYHSSNSFMYGMSASNMHKLVCP